MIVREESYPIYTGLIGGDAGFSGMQHNTYSMKCGWSTSTNSDGKDILIVSYVSGGKKVWRVVSRVYGTAYVFTHTAVRRIPTTATPILQVFYFSGSFPFCSHRDFHTSERSRSARCKLRRGNSLREGKDGRVYSEGLFSSARLRAIFSASHAMPSICEPIIEHSENLCPCEFTFRSRRRSCWSRRGRRL